MDSNPVPERLARCDGSEILILLRDKIFPKIGRRKPNLYACDPSSVYGTVVKCLTNSKISSLEERQYVCKLWLTNKESHVERDPSEKINKGRRKKIIRHSNVELNSTGEQSLPSLSRSIYEKNLQKELSKAKKKAAKEFEIREEARAIISKFAQKQLQNKTANSSQNINGSPYTCTLSVSNQSKRTASNENVIESEASGQLPSTAVQSPSSPTQNSPSLSGYLSSGLRNLTNAFKRFRTTDSQANAASNICQSGNSSGNPLAEGPNRSPEMDCEFLQSVLDHDPLLEHLINEYQTRINAFPTYKCPICHRLIYQTKYSTKIIKLSHAFIENVRKHDCMELEPDQTLRLCTRCHSAVDKNRVPSMGFMNKMEIMQYPQEILSLNTIEARLISQVKPFMKIYKLSKGRGQLALKGSCIHFPQNVDEVIKTLPIAPGNSDIVLVNEVNDQGHDLAEYQVRADKLYQALLWLKQNNTLYDDVEIEDIPEPRLQIEQIYLPPVSSGHNAEQSVDQLTQGGNGSTDIGDGRRILRADFHQGTHEVFPTGGSQCTGMAAAAIAHSSYQKCNTWTTKFLNMILLIGDAYYDVLHELHQHELLESSESAGYVWCFNIFPVEVEPMEDDIRGFFANIPGQKELEPAIQEFIDSAFNYAIFTGNEKSLAFMKEDEYIFVFDPHSCGPHGHTADDGKACLLRYDISNAAKQMRTLINRNVKPGQSFRHNMTELEKVKYQFSIRPITCRMITRDDDGNVFIQTGEVIRIGPTPSSSTQRAFNSTAPCQGAANDMHEAMENEVILEMPIAANATSVDCVIREDQPIEPEIEQHIRQIKINRQRGAPMYPSIDNRLEELCFVKSLPYGDGGFTEERKTKITPLDYYQQRIMGANPHFHSNEFLFYALSRVEQYIVQQKIAVCGNMTTEAGTREEGENFVQGLQNAHLYMSAIRGSSSYWKRYAGDVLCMIEQLSTPTFFLTISYDDLNSIDCLTALWKASHGPDEELPCPPSEIPYNDRRDLLNDNPVASSRHFCHKMNIILDILKKSSIYLFGAPLENYTYRVEFQGRGSAHCHALLWLKEAPDWETEEGLAFIDANISCSLDVPFRDTVLRYQNHHHTKTCFKKNDSNCRFGFPRKATAATKVLDEEEITKNYGRFVELERTKEEVMINNYHPKLLQLLQCNIDIQPVTGSRAIAYYIGKYMSKSEPDHLREEISKTIEKFRSDRSSSYHQKALSIASKIISQREISAPEAAFRLCHLPLRRSSRATFFVPTYQPQFRIRMARNDSIGENETQFHLNIFDRYVNRPNTNEFAPISLIEFASLFTPEKKKSRQDLETDLIEDEEEIDAEAVIESSKFQLQNGKGKMSRRKHPAIIKHPFFNPIEKRDDYLYSLILLYYPFWNEDDILNMKQPDGTTLTRTILEAFNELSPNFRTSDHNPIIRPDLLDKISDVLFLLEEEYSQNESNNHDADYGEFNCFFENDPEQLNENEIFVPAQGVTGNAEDTIQQRVSKLNDEQARLFHKIKRKILGGESLPQMLEFILGAGGVGKTFLIQILTMVIQTVCTGGHRALIKVAPTGVAARAIEGTTLHKAFCLGVEKNSVAKYVPLGGSKLEDRRRIFRDVQFIIIDEISMISYEVLRMLHLRLCEITGLNSLFGGKNVLMFGDLLQLMPVRGAWIFHQPSYFSAEPHLWNCFSFNELSKCMRQNPDDPFYNILQRLRFGTLRYEDTEKLKERLLNPLKDNYLEMAKESYSSLHLYPKIKQVDPYNEDRLVGLACEGIKVYKINAHDTFADGKQFGHKVPDSVIPKDIRKCGGIAKTLCIARTCKVMLKYNKDVLGGLCNGSIGEVRGFSWRGLRRDQREDGDLPDSVLIHFEGKIDPKHFSSDPEYTDCVPITPKAFEFVGNRGARVSRLQLGICICYATTIHKSQGMTLDKATIHLGKELFIQGQAYVAASRVRTWEGLYITDLDPNKLIVNKKRSGPCNEKPLRELYRLKLLQIGIEDEIFLKSLITWILEYVICNTCKYWICLCSCESQQL